ncbi:MAG TPA: hypothetical protein VGX03_32340 [Candidatus Binatia bacterium]|nr:hypothetical protein [Candidatus Binatia bacterium]
MTTQRVLGLLLTLCLFTPGAAFANPPTDSFELHLEVPNVSEAPNGDRIAVTGEAVFTVHPKSVSATGTFTHTDSQGNVLGEGTWVATQLLDYQTYGCGVLAATVPPTPLPANLCGGALRMRVLLTAGGNQFEGILAVFCIIGPNPPNSHDEFTEEGVSLNVIGVSDFNKIVTGANVFIRTSS